MITRKNSRRRRLGQGMTEYVVIVGLIGLCLVVAVTRYATQVEVTIIGSSEEFDRNNVGSNTGHNSRNPDAPPPPAGTRPPAEWGEPDGRGIYTHPNGTTGRWNGTSMDIIRPNQ
ncbi:MAG: hypothetical protein M9894_19735 [Planctomycetes bacterium]|nr:hypothetical protein [Planctomycetota bacterium]